MTQRPKRNRATGSELTRNLAQNASVQQIDQHLMRIFLGLSQLLVRQGYGYGRLAELAKLAFVDAASCIDRDARSRATNARIAALTGLTRLEVSRLLKVDRSRPVVAHDQLNRATRVAIGWLTDNSFTTAQHKPRSLPFSAPRSGFAQLVKKYSGDIPARAMLIEMTRLGLVRRNSSGNVSLTRLEPPLSRTTAAAIRAIAPWVDGVTSTNNSDTSSSLASHVQQIRLHFQSPAEAYAAAREFRTRWNSFVTSVQQLGTTKKQTGPFEFILSLAVATTKPRNRRRQKK